jgi:hypothetical protein
VPTGAEPVYKSKINTLVTEAMKQEIQDLASTDSVPQAYVLRLALATGLSAIQAEYQKERWQEYRRNEALAVGEQAGPLPTRAPGVSVPIGSVGFSDLETARDVLAGLRLDGAASPVESAAE